MLDLAAFDSTVDIKEFIAAVTAAKDGLLGPTIKGIANSRFVTADDFADLTKGRIARNYVAHESVKIGPLGYLRTKDAAETLAALRSPVIDLATGDNVISCWIFVIEEKQVAPEWMSQTYETRVLSWVFGEPFEGCSSSTEWTLRQLAQRPPR